MTPTTVSARAGPLGADPVPLASGGAASSGACGGESPPAPLLADCRRRLAAHGLNLFGVVDARRFDQGEFPGRRLRDRMPRCRSAVVVGAGGPDLWRRHAGAVVRGGNGHASVISLEEHCAALLLMEAEALREAGVDARVALPRARSPLNFLKLGEEAGLGVVSPVLFLLVHPRYGPRVRLAGALLLDRGFPSTGPLEDFAPCATCHRPCVSACPVGVFEQGAPDYFRCGEHLSQGGCAGACEAHRSCPVGTDHGWDPTEARRNQEESLRMLRRHFGMGLWRLVPKPLR